MARGPPLRPRWPLSVPRARQPRCRSQGTGLAWLALAPAGAALSVLPLSAFEGDWYGPGVQRGRVLRRLVQTHRLWVEEAAGTGTVALVATKLVGDWARGDVGAPNELLWRVQRPVGEAALPLRPATPARAELQLAATSSVAAGERLLTEAMVSAVSRDELALEVQGKVCSYHRVGAVGLERAFRPPGSQGIQAVDVADAVASGPYRLRRLLFDYAGGAARLLPAAAPLVEVQHLWRAGGAVLLVVFPERGGPSSMPSAALLAAARELHAGAAEGRRRPPRLVLLWPEVTATPTVEALGVAKEELGPKAELYADAGGGAVLEVLAAEGDTSGPAVLLAVVSPSGAWRGARVGSQGNHGDPCLAALRAAAAELLGGARAA